MGRTMTPTYRVEMYVPGFYYTPAAWRVRGYGQVKGDGKPTDANLAKYVAHFEAATQPGGANEHLGRTRVSRAKIVRQRDDEVMATYAAS